MICKFTYAFSVIRKFYIKRRIDKHLLFKFNKKYLIKSILRSHTIFNTQFIFTHRHVFIFKGVF